MSFAINRTKWLTYYYQLLISGQKMLDLMRQYGSYNIFAIFFS